MKSFDLIRPRIRTTGFVSHVRKYKKKIYVKFVTPMRIEVSAMVPYTEKQYKSLLAAMKKGETVSIKY